MTHSFWWLLIDALATYRLAVLISKDKITEPARDTLRDRAYLAGVPRKGHALARWTFELVICPWCIGVWIAAAVTGLTVSAPSVWQYPAFGLALTGAAGFLAER
jgi:hypothetical protein